jgi:predicted dehydrogenase
MPPSAYSLEENDKNVRVGVIGIGQRGSILLKTLLELKGVEISSLCDINLSRATSAARSIGNMGRKLPSVYGATENSYKEMLDKEKLDAVIIATPWDSHAAMALHAMKNGTYPGVEVPAALKVEDLWQLVETSEKAGIPCMMLENRSFCNENLALLNMKRLGLFGDIVHCHCAHSHDLADFWFFDAKNGEPNWAADYLVKYNRDQLPTQSLGPIISWMDINHGDIFTEIYSRASSCNAINAFFNREFGKDFPAGKLNYKQGDVITSILKTKMGKTLVINSDLQLPRPYDNRWMLQGTKGIFDEAHNAVFIEGKTKEYHQWEPLKPYAEKYNHKWWDADYSSKENEGTDFVMLREFVEAVRSKGPVPLDVYDSAVMSAVVELSGISIEKNAPVAFPDFTRGKWETNKAKFGI